MRRPPFFAFTSLAPAAAAFALASCGPTQAREAEAPAGPLVEVVVVQPAGALGAVRGSGLVGYKIETPLSFNTAGVIERILVDEGDSVQRGQRLATLQRTGAAGDTSETALARQTAERHLARTEQLFERGFASQAALDDARLAARRARDSSVISAPAAGVILRRLAEPAQMMQPAAPVLVLGDVNSGMIVRVSIPSTAAARIEIGAPAQVQVAAAASPLRGAVTRVAAKSDDRTGAFEAEIRLDGAEGLRSGLVAEVEIAGRAAPGESAAIVAPALALLDARADQGVVFVVDDESIARRRAVQTAGLTEDGVVIVAGLSPGERIVAAGAAYVRDGEPVRAAPTQATN